MHPFFLPAVKYQARVQGQPQSFAASAPEGTEFTVEAGLEGMRGLQEAVQRMKKGEKALVELQPECEWPSAF
jgi:FKBP-type peptidyl-prolyl cis-trans isomerase